MHISASSEKSRCSFLLEASDERTESVTSKLSEYNRFKTSERPSIPIQPGASPQIYSLEEEGSIVGGLIGRTNEPPEWPEVSIIRVVEDRRGQGT